MENNNQDQLQQEEEIASIEQFQVGRVPSEDREQQDPQYNASDDDVELGFTEEEPKGEELDVHRDDENDADDDVEGEPGDEDAEFESPDDDPA